jgi:outer membrane protein OmpA-like peptidoglycan-associated protein
MNSLLHKNSFASEQLMPIGKLKQSVQPKLTINTPGDIYEQEADAMADSVMRMPSNEPAKTVIGLIGKSLQRKCTHCEDEEKKKKPIMRKAEAGNSGISVSSSFASSLNASKGGGSSLPQGTRSFMENSFSADFSKVKIHTDSQASEMNKDINAKAFTTGSDIYFKSGEYSPNSEDGKKLLAHELTHVVQQENGIDSKIQRLGDLSKVPPMACNVATASSGGTSAASSLFPTSSTSLSATQQSGIATFVLSWQASGGRDILRIDGYASTSGADEMNWQLSCDRALSVANELRNNGVPDTMIEIFAQGETAEFGAQGNNQRTNISIIGSPAPVCGAAPPTPVGGTAPLLTNPGIGSGSLCRGACGSDCPTTCTAQADVNLCLPDSSGTCHYTYTYQSVQECGSHIGCRVHDSCYDLCGPDIYDSCHRSCDWNCFSTHGASQCNEWRQGNGPFDSRLRYSNAPIILGPIPGPCTP